MPTGNQIRLAVRDELQQLRAELPTREQQDSILIMLRALKPEETPCLQERF